MLIANSLVKNEPWDCYRVQIGVIISAHDFMQLLKNVITNDWLWPQKFLNETQTAPPNVVKKNVLCFYDKQGMVSFKNEKNLLSGI